MAQAIVTLLGVAVGWQMFFVSPCTAENNKRGGGSNTMSNDNPDSVVSHTVDQSKQKFEWTLERMLMATPMPMTQEERTFSATWPMLSESLKKP